MKLFRWSNIDIAIAAIAFLLCLAASASAQIDASPWPMFHHDSRHTGLSTYSTASNPGSVKWQFTTVYSFVSSPVVGAEGTIYVTSTSPFTALYAINPDGTQKWNTGLGLPIDTPQPSPAIGPGGLIVIASGNGDLYGINPVDGSIEFAETLGANLNSSPTIGADGTIYILTLGGLLALSPSPKWVAPFVIGFYSSPTIGPDNTIYVGADGYLYAVSHDGSYKWRFATGQQESTPAIGPDGTIYVGSDNPSLYAINPDGSQKWQTAIFGSGGGGVASCPAVSSDGTIYVDSDRALYAIDPTGSVKWKFAIPAGISTSPTISADETIYVGALDNKLYAINADGTQKWTFATAPSNTNSPVFSSPAIGVDGTIYVGNLIPGGDDRASLFAIGNPSISPSPSPTATPTPAATDTATLIATGTATATATKTATPTPTQTPIAENVTALPKKLNFGKVTVGNSSRPEFVTVKNVGKRKGGLAVTIRAATTATTSSATFTVVSQCSPPSLEPSASCKIGVTYRPAGSDISADLGVLMIPTNTNLGFLTVTLSGAGKAVKPRK